MIVGYRTGIPLSVFWCKRDNYLSQYPEQLC
jgi:hypothetical protein